MSDLTFQQLSDALTNDVVTTSNGNTALPAGVYVNISKLIGNTSGMTLASEGVTEAAVKFLAACNRAQVANNAVANAPQISSFPESSYGTPRKNAGGEIEASVFASVTGVLPISDATITAQV